MAQRLALPMQIKMMENLMDRELSAEFKRKQKIKVAIVAGLVLIAIVLAFFVFRGFIKPSVNRSKITIAIAEMGTLEATIPATGVVVPENELLITSPINAKIEKVLFRAGDAVKMGESLLQLNRESTQKNYDKLLDAQKVNQNKINQLKLSLERTINDLQTQYAVKEMRIQSLESDLNSEQSLLKIGGGTPEKVKQATVNLNVAKLELKQLKNQISNQEKTMQADLTSLGYEMSIQQKDIQELSNMLNQAEVRSPIKGIIIWINEQIGAEINQGADIVKIADLSSYKVTATVSDSYATYVKVGGSAIVRINEVDIRGVITNVQPAVENGSVKFMVSLNNKNHSLLRSNLKADVFVVSSVKDNVVRIKNGPAFNGSAQQKVFVILDNEAVSRTITIGESNFDYLEIKSGLKAGDRVIVSDMEQFVNQPKVQIND